MKLEHICPTMPFENGAEPKTYFFLKKYPILYFGYGEKDVIDSYNDNAIGISRYFCTDKYLKNFNT